jgi:hypothetical protein
MPVLARGHGIFTARIEGMGLQLEFESDFGLLVDLSGDPTKN